jgi:hypothetical protein
MGVSDPNGGFVRNTGDAIKNALHGTSVEMDGHEVGKLVTEHQADQDDKPPSGPSSFDYRLSPAHPTGPLTMWPAHRRQQSVRWNASSHPGELILAAYCAHRSSFLIKQLPRLRHLQHAR